MTVRILHGDCRAKLAEMEAASVHAIVTDPPYELGFMGKAWDGSGIAYDVEVWRQCLRVLKPGGHLLAFGGARTYHRLACAVEDAGFEIRDQIMWLYGSGFPKSYNVSVAIDRAAGAEREVVAARQGVTKTFNVGAREALKERPPITAPNTAAAAAAAAAGWGTALKPAHEPIVVARKPFKGTVADNFVTHGTGALNIDASRIEWASQEDKAAAAAAEQRSRQGVERSYDGWGMQQQELTAEEYAARSPGRWPANVAHDGSEEVVALFPEDAPSGGHISRRMAPKSKNCFGDLGCPPEERVGFPDSGSAARFFYCSKATKEDREAGLEWLDARAHAQSGGAQQALANGEDYEAAQGIGLNCVKHVRNHHPTVKPVALMQWLCRLVTPKEGIVLDPFMGSGSTGKAALREGFSFVGIELQAEYIEIAKRRIHSDAPLFAEALSA